MMKITKLVNLYKELENIYCSHFPGKLKVSLNNFGKDYSKPFSINLELLVLTHVSEDNYGIVYSTDFQKTSSLNESLIASDGTIYALSDISFANGSIITSLHEELLNINDIDYIQYFLKVEKLFKENLSNIKSILKNDFSTHEN